MNTKINFNRYTHVLFDFDGTIADTFEISLKSYNLYAKAKKIPRLDLVTAKHLKTLPYPQIIQTLNLKPWQIPSMLTTVQKNVAQFLPEADTFPHMINLIENLHQSGKKIGIITSNSAKNVENFLEHKNISKNLFSCIYASRNILGKHHTFKKMFREQSFSAQKALYFGDEVRDIKACQKVGMDIAAVTWGWNEKKLLEAAQPNYLVDSIKGLLE